MSATAPTVVVLGRAPSADGKTRLTAGLRPGAARRLRTALLLDTVEAALAGGGEVCLSVTPEAGVEECAALVVGDAVLSRDAARLSVRPQPSGDLGARIADALAQPVTHGGGPLVVGSDLPDLPRELLQQAADALRASAAQGTRGVVLGPSLDGGYYLIGATGAVPELLTDMPWGTSQVFALSVSRARAADITLLTLPPWRDIDTPDDMHALLASRGASAPRTRGWAAGHGDARKIAARPTA